MQYNPRTGEPIIDPRLEQGFTQATNAGINPSAWTAQGARPIVRGLRGGAAEAASTYNPQTAPIIQSRKNFLATPQGQEFTNQGDEWFRWSVAHDPGFLNNVAKGLGSLPIVGGVVRGAQELLSRPGDLLHDPLKYMGAAAQVAAPFTGAQIGPWAKVLGAGGNALQTGAYKNPATLVGTAANAAAPFLGGDAAKGLIAGGNFFNALEKGNMKPGGGATRSTGTNTMPNGIAYPQSQPYDTAAMPATRDVNPLSFLGGSNTGNQIAGAVGLATMGNTDKPYPDLNNMGVLGKTQGVMSNMASNAGVADPWTGQGGSTNPYNLMPHEQEAFNTTADMVNQGRGAALANLRQRMAMMGIDDPRASAAAEAAIHAGHNQMLADTHSNLMNQSFQNRQSTLSQFGQMIPQLYGDQAQAKQLNTVNQRYQNNQLGSNLRMLFPTGKPFTVPGLGGGGGGAGMGYPGGNGGFDQGVPLDENGLPINAANAPNYGLPGGGPWATGEANVGLPGSDYVGNGAYSFSPDAYSPDMGSWMDYGIPGLEDIGGYGDAFTGIF